MHKIYTILLTVTGGISIYGGSNGLTDTEQHIIGIKRFDDVAVFNKAYTINSTVQASTINLYGLTVGAPICPTSDNMAVTLQGRRGSSSSTTDVMIEPQQYRDAGYLFGINDLPGGGGQFFGVAANGDVNFSMPQRWYARHPEDPRWDGNLTDNTQLSGHIALKGAATQYLALGPRLSMNHSARQPDGGRPIADGGTWVQTESDGGTYYAYGGLHGAVSIVPYESHFAGWMFQTANNGLNAFIDYNGGFGNSPGLPIAQFPNCPATSVSIGGGLTYYYGALKSTLLYASDTEHWYVCKSAGWKKITDETD